MLTNGLRVGMEVGSALGVNLTLSVVPVPVKFGKGVASYSESSLSILSN